MYSDAGTAVAESLCVGQVLVPAGLHRVDLEDRALRSTGTGGRGPGEGADQAGDSDGGEDGAGEAAARHEDSWRTTVANPATLRRVTVAGKTADG